MNRSAILTQEVFEFESFLLLSILCSIWGLERLHDYTILQTLTCFALSSVLMYFAWGNYTDSRQIYKNIKNSKIAVKPIWICLVLFYSLLMILSFISCITAIHGKDVAQIIDGASNFEIIMFFSFFLGSSLLFSISVPIDPARGVDPN